MLELHCKALVQLRQIKERQFDKGNTKWGVKIFNEWLIENNISITFEAMTPSDLDNSLAKFYVELREVDGATYSKVSYICIRLLSSEKYRIRHLILQVLKYSTFSHSNLVIKAMLKTLNACGMAVDSYF